MKQDPQRLVEAAARALAGGQRPRLSRAEIEATVQELRTLQLAPERRVLLDLAMALGVGRPSPEVAGPLLDRLLAQTIARLETLSLEPDPDGPLDLPAVRDRAFLALRRFLLPAADCTALGRGLRPEPGDYERVFTSEHAARGRQAYEALQVGPEVFPAPLRGQTELLCEAAWSQDLSAEELPPLFPGGMRRVAPLLAPGRAWVAWKFVKPRAREGMAFCGLVWLDGRFAFFPKPYRVLG